MRNAGLLMMALGAMMALFAFATDTTVHSSGTFIGSELVGGGSSYNLGLLQKQMMILHTGLALFVAGSFLLSSKDREGRNYSRYTASDGRSHEQIGEEIAQEIEEEQKRNRVGLILLGVAGALLVLLWLAR